jgi:aminopeptidase N
LTQENVSTDTLALQVRLDTDPFNRVEAMRRLTDQQRIGLLLEPNKVIDSDWLTIYGEILVDKSLSPGLKAYFLRIEEQPMDRAYTTWFQELVEARDRLAKAVNAKYRDRLVELYKEMQAYVPGDSPNDGIEQRILKHVALDLIAIDDTAESHCMILNHYNTAKTASERVAALAALNKCSAPERREVLEQVYQHWHFHLSGYANYLRIIASGARDDVFDMIEFEKSRSTFDVTQPTWARALLLPMAHNNKKVWTDQGIRWVKDTVVWLASINDYTASRLLNVFQHCHNLRPTLRPKVQAALEQILVQVPEKVSPMINGQAKTYLGGKK